MGRYCFLANLPAMMACDNLDSEVLAIESLEAVRGTSAKRSKRVLIRLVNNGSDSTDPCNWTSSEGMTIPVPSLAPYASIDVSLPFVPILAGDKIEAKPKPVLESPRLPEASAIVLAVGFGKRSYAPGAVAFFNEKVAMRQYDSERNTITPIIYVDRGAQVEHYEMVELIKDSLLELRVQLRIDSKFIL